MSKAILEKYFRCGIHDGDDSRRWKPPKGVPQRLVAPAPPQPHAMVLFHITAIPLAAELASCLPPELPLLSSWQESGDVSDKPTLLVVSISLWILAGQQWVGWRV